MKSLIDKMAEYNSWVLFCNLIHKSTKENWFPLGLKVSTQEITIGKYELYEDGTKNPHKLIACGKLTIDQIYKKFEIL